MINCIVIENEPLAIEILIRYISKRDDLKLTAIVKELEVLNQFVDLQDVHIIFLDLIVPPGNAGGFHYGQLPDNSKIVTISAIPLHLYDDASLLTDPYELRKPFSYRSFCECVDSIKKEKFGKEARTRH